jgi:hypothetical protein
LKSVKSTRSSRSWRLGGITDQGNNPHCVGHAWYSWFSCSPVRQHPIVPDGIYTLAQYFDEWIGQDYDGTSVRGGAKVLKITGHIKKYSFEWRLEPAINYLLENGPLVLGINWYSGMMLPRNGYIKVTGNILGGHAVLLYGVNINREEVSIANSWGQSWGNRGTAKLSLEDFSKLLGEDGECCAAEEIIN